LTTFCEVCGSELTRTRYFISADGYFCSEACHDKSPVIQERMKAAAADRKHR
jgi:hypothetical protein